MDTNDIFALVRSGNLEKLKSLYDVQHMDLNMVDEEGTPLIVYASKEQRGGIVDWLLNHNANPDAQDKYGKTALIWASEYADNYIITVLLRQGANPNIKDAEGKTALRHFITAKYEELDNIIVSTGHEETLKMLGGFYHYGADCFLKDNKGVSAADMLNQADSYFFQTHGYIPGRFTPGKDKIIDSDGPLYFLARALISQNNKGAVNLAKVIEDINATEKDRGDTALMFAAIYGNEKVVEILLKRGANPDLTDEHGRTALMKAAQGCHTKVMRLLLEYGADVNKSDTLSNNTALMDACLAEPTEIALDAMEEAVKLLLDAGADKNIKCTDGRTAFDLAEDCGNYELLDILKTYKPQKVVRKNVSLLDDRLIQAVLSENTNAFQSYMHKGNDAICVTKNNKKEMHYGNNLYSFDADGKTLFDHAIENKCLKSLKFMLYLGMYVNLKNKKGQTPLYVAHRENYKEAINLLLSYGADRSSVRKVDLQEFQDAREEDNGQFLSSNLIQAVLQEDKEALVLLLEAGKDASLTDREGKTLFDYAIENNRLRGLFNLVSLSRDINFNIDINLKNKDDQTPLDKAYSVGFKDAADLLLAFGAKTSPQKVGSQKTTHYQKSSENQYGY